MCRWNSVNRLIAKCNVPVPNTDGNGASRDALTVRVRNLARAAVEVEHRRVETAAPRHGLAQAWSEVAHRRRVMHVALRKRPAHIQLIKTLIPTGRWLLENRL